MVGFYNARQADVRLHPPDGPQSLIQSIPAFPQLSSSSRAEIRISLRRYLRGLEIGYDKAGELLVQMRRNAGLEPRGFSIVTALDDLPHRVEPGHHCRFVVRHAQLDEVAARPEQRTEFGQQFRKSLARFSRNANSVRKSVNEVVQQMIGAEAIHFVKDH